MAKKVQPSASSNASSAVSRLFLLNDRIGLYGDENRLKALLPSILHKSSTSAVDADSLQEGIKERPIDVHAIRRLKRYSEHHETSVNATVAAVVGLGHILDTEQGAPDPLSPDRSVDAANERLVKAITPPKTPPGGGQADVPAPKPRPTATQRLMSRADIILDPLCDHSWQQVLTSCGYDLVETGNSYIEVVRKKRTHEIVGARSRSAGDVRVYYDGDGEWHYVIQPSSESSLYGAMLGSEYHVARFDQTAVTRARLLDIDKRGVTLESFKRGNKSAGVYREIIDICDLTNENRWYGMPRWLSALPMIDLKRAINHYYADFFHNHAVPDLLLVVSGAHGLEAKDWTALEDSLKQTKGLGNQHKSMAIKMDNPEAKVEVHKLAMEMKSDSFAAASDAVNLSIVTAHGIPPLLAGIQTPGKLGANNELPNALQAFQALKIGRLQRIIQQRLGKTIGSERAGLGLTLSDFEFYTILDEIDIGTAQTVAGMKQPLAEAKAQGRDISAGLKD